MLFDAIYLVAMLILSPWLLWRAVRTRRYRHDLRAKLTGRNTLTPTDEPRVWFHGVSVGEIHLLATLIDAYRRRHPDHRIVVSSTTDTGLAEARKRFEHVIVWPFDFSWAVRSALESVRPSLVVLAEAEMWPNFLRIAEMQGIPVAVINARLSPRSFRRYRRVAGLARRLFFNRVEVIAVQGADYAERFRSVGATNVIATGSIKYDGAMKSPTTPTWCTKNAQTNVLVWVAGSTHAPEEAIVLAAFARLRVEFPELRLVLVPRHPDRFEEVALLIAATGIAFQRRSRVTVPLDELPPIFLLDTVGELAAAWSIACVGYVGGTLDGRRGGQSMIEPAGYGVPTVFGPHVWNFKDTAHRLVVRGGALMVASEEGVVESVATLLRSAKLRAEIGSIAREFVAEQQGATDRTLDVIDGLAYTSTVRHAA